MLDYGQVKELPNSLRFGYANLILAIADNDHIRASEGLRYYTITSLFFWSESQLLKQQKKSRSTLIS